MRNESEPTGIVEPANSIESAEKAARGPHDEVSQVQKPQVIDSSADLEGAAATISPELARRTRERQEAIARARFRSLGKVTGIRRIGSRRRG